MILSEETKLIDHLEELVCKITICESGNNLIGHLKPTFNFANEGVEVQKR